MAFVVDRTRGNADGRSAVQHPIALPVGQG